ncbi:MAG TPA: OmpA family protein, partial [Polyangiaceae bacterium]
YVQTLISAKRVAAFQLQIAASERQLSALTAEIATGKAELSGSVTKLGEQQAVLAENQRQIDALHAQLQNIAVLRVSVLDKLKQAVEAQLGASDEAGAPLVTIGDNGNVVINESLMFEYGSYAIKKEAKPLLDRLAKALANVLDDPNVRANIDTIVIQGHTDERGSAAFNWDLSAKRATAVLGYLFEADRTLADAYGRYFSAGAYSKFRPIDPGTTEDAYQHNRRIEISVVPRDDTVRQIVDDYARR